MGGDTTSATLPSRGTKKGAMVKQHKTRNHFILSSLSLSFKYDLNTPFFSVPSNNGDLIFLEPWRTFEVVDPGIRRPKSKTSIVPLRMADGELIYEKEIAPSVSQHVLKALRERIGDTESVRGMLSVLSSYKFDIRGNI